MYQPTLPPPVSCVYLAIRLPPSPTRSDQTPANLPLQHCLEARLLEQPTHKLCPPSFPSSSAPSSGTLYLLTFRQAATASAQLRNIILCLFTSHHCASTNVIIATTYCSQLAIITNIPSTATNHTMLAYCYHFFWLLFSVFSSATMFSFLVVCTRFFLLTVSVWAHVTVLHHIESYY